MKNQSDIISLLTAVTNLKAIAQRSELTTNHYLYNLQNWYIRLSKTLDVLGKGSLLISNVKETSMFNLPPTTYQSTS